MRERTNTVCLSLLVLFSVFFLSAHICHLRRLGGDSTKDDQAEFHVPGTCLPSTHEHFGIHVQLLDSLF
jgi:hypothetical protein